MLELYVLLSNRSCQGKYCIDVPLWVHVSELCNMQGTFPLLSPVYHCYCEGQFPKCVNEWMSGGEYPFTTCSSTCVSPLLIHFWNSEQICDSACTKWEVIWLSLIHNSVWSVIDNCCLLFWIWFVILNDQSLMGQVALLSFFTSFLASDSVKMSPCIVIVSVYWYSGIWSVVALLNIVLSWIMQCCACCPTTPHLVRCNVSFTLNIHNLLLKVWQSAL